ncbi:MULTISPECIES: serine hydrolase [unclassified Saccharopolyspora]|uniref:serine hydrolase n=1 Tax=unclassified Saccharopolyspora TaxID=2646250 RepID=UPI001CD7080D|nr:MULTISPECIES: serine hydrolase [unclassified Saccharopolyspora]MCA1188307.1 class A beta-lactamase-related serine hydrolase [Saccharopolyspora sp. 6T]MCA1193483.1 class A beta-lactamase-related serine hydrolase [Saccharopolyspora sp. 6V]MCA1229497.1 class A beta-lactamase-related serine hydrolase [Saccharopolyspora sp. 6M]MCA1280522.1 class A beta-lactamase-related serine hydrolase [Saccharopolyspora sp. 7B]
MNAEALIGELLAELDDGGLRGSFLVRDLDSGREIGIEPDVAHPVASLIKIPLVAATLERVRRGELDGAAEVLVRPGAITTPGPTGLSRFRHPARVALDDLMYLAVALSDNVAADALFALTSPAEVTRMLREWGLRGITARHLVGDLSETPAERFAAADVHLAHALAIGARTADRGHPLAQLDVTRANSGSARDFVDLLQELWRPDRIAEPVAERTRELLGANLLRHRLAPDFSSDATTWSSKTGTLLNLRHEVGVVEHDDGHRFAIAALTESRVPAATQPEAEFLMARTARRLRDHLRRW